jgi:nuclear-control-of-ATPase protein 2
MSTFARRQTDGLLAAVVPPHFVGIENDASSNKHELQSLFLSLSPPISSSSLAVRDAINYLEDLQRRTIQHGGAFQLDATGSQAEEEEMRMAASVVCRVTVALYAEMLEDHLDQAGTAQVEAEWWDDVARSRLSVLYYLIQS